MNTHQFYRATASGFQKLTIVILLLFVGSYSAMAQQCNSELAVEKNRKFKSVSEEGATFTLVLTNNSAKSTSYMISTIQLEEACGNNLVKTSKPNVPVNVNILSNDRKALANNSISVSANSTKKFKVLVTAPNGSPTNAWGCIQVTAKSDNCETGTNTILSAWVSDNVE